MHKIINFSLLISDNNLAKKKRRTLKNQNLYFKKTIQDIDGYTDRATSIYPGKRLYNSYPVEHYVPFVFLSLKTSTKLGLATVDKKKKLSICILVRFESMNKRLMNAKEQNKKS